MVTLWSMSLECSESGVRLGIVVPDIRVDCYGQQADEGRVCGWRWLLNGWSADGLWSGLKLL